MSIISSIKEFLSGFRQRPPGSGPPMPIPKPKPLAPRQVDARNFINSSQWKCNVCCSINKSEHSLCTDCTMTDILKEIENLDGGCYSWEDYEND